MRGPRLALLAVPVIAGLAVAATFAFTSDDDTAASSGGGDRVVISNFEFEPEAITVAPGAAVRVVNEDGTAHTLTADDGGFDTGDLDDSASATVTAPSKPGSYGYFCEIHDYMTGTLRVA